MDPALSHEIISILDDANDMTIATVREDGYPQATTVSYVNDGHCQLSGPRVLFSDPARLERGSTIGEQRSTRPELLHHQYDEHTTAT